MEGTVSICTGPVPEVGDDTETEVCPAADDRGGCIGVTETAGDRNICAGMWLLLPPSTVAKPGARAAARAALVTIGAGALLDKESRVR